MNRIRLLPEQVANQIAAGEVIERPASVVKELVENALDAQAARILVEIGAGGRSLIRVTDDGLGMSRDDALLCLERHATSKIKRAEDLAAIQTMGFRGEALPSIASVSRMSLTTRERENPAGISTQITIHGGKILEVREAGAPPGTCIEVRNLFYNLPARRKFLRTEETETSHIQHYLTLAALAAPETAFTFSRDTRTIWQLPAVKGGETSSGRLTALRERMRALFGGEQEFVPVNFEASLAELPGYDSRDEPETGAVAFQPSTFRLWGYIGAPGVSRATREDQHLFVNRRPVENRALNFSLLEGYHTSLMKGRYPVCCLFLEMDPAGVDVNIHPAKREVKFHNEREVRRLVTQAVRGTLLGLQTPPGPGTIPPTRWPGEHKEDGLQNSLPVDKLASAHAPLPTSDAEVPPHVPTPGAQALPLRRAVPPSPDIPPNQLSLATPPPASSLAQPERPPALTPGRPEPTPGQSAGSGSAASEPAAPGAPTSRTETALPLLGVPLRILGVIQKLYVVMESDRGLVLLDQHAAHERILFEQMLQRLEQGSSPSQRLLLPETMELSARDAQFVRELLPLLVRLGIGLAEFGERTFLLDALPPMVQPPHARRFVLDVLDELRASGESVNAMRLSEHVVAKTVCRHAVKAHDPLSGPEVERLLSDLRQCAMPYTCPHGRPTMIEMSLRELEKKFGRIV